MKEKGGDGQSVTIEDLFFKPFDEKKKKSVCMKNDSERCFTQSRANNPMNLFEILTDTFYKKILRVSSYK